MFGTIFGFGLTAMSIVLAFAESPRLHILRRSRHWTTPWRVFSRGIRTFLLVALTGLAAIIVDRDKAPASIAPYIVMLFVFLGVARIYRVLWAFENLIHVMTLPDEFATGHEAEHGEYVGSR